MGVSGFATNHHSFVSPLVNKLLLQLISFTDKEPFDSLKRHKWLKTHKNLNYVTPHHQSIKPTQKAPCTYSFHLIPNTDLISIPLSAIFYLSICQHIFGFYLNTDSCIDSITTAIREQDMPAPRDILFVARNTSPGRSIVPNLIISSMLNSLKNLAVSW